MRMRRYLVTFLTGVITLSTCAIAAPMASRILQYSHQRLYFANGSDDNVYPDARFVVTIGTDTVASGTIEFSGPGISYSYPIENMLDSSEEHSWQAVIEAADVDSLSPIVLGTTGYNPSGDTDIITETGSPVKVVTYASDLAMQLDLEAGSIDGCFSYDRFPVIKPGYEFASSPAPYYCTIVPGIADHAQRNGLLTTALYYRFNEDKYPLVFDGDGLIPIDRLCIALGDSPRHYRFDPDRGRALGRELAHSTRTISLYMSDHSLEKAALYFSDILSRDRIRTTLADDDGEADCRLIFAPVDVSEKGTSLNFLYQYLIADTSAGDPVNQTVRMVGKYLELVRTTHDSTQAARFLALAEQSMAEDIGVLPLFRPSVYFVARKEIKGYSFGPSGNFEVCRMVKIRFPSERTGDSR